MEIDNYRTRLIELLCQNWQRKGKVVLLCLAQKVKWQKIEISGHDSFNSVFSGQGLEGDRSGSLGCTWRRNSNSCGKQIE